MEERLHLYHTGFHELRSPDITVGRKNADFGQGFYLSANDAFAGKWARESRGRQVYVNAYELDLSGLTLLRFGRDAGWFDYIFQNRRAMPDAELGGFGAELQRETAAYQRAIAAVLEEEE